MAERESTGLPANVIWACGSDENYREKAEPYLKSLVEHGINPIHLTVDYDIYDLAARKRDITPLNGVHYVTVSSEDFKARSPINCLQHGDFLHALPSVEGDPTIVFTDCDIICQRPLDPMEQHMLEWWPEHAVGVQWNNGEGDSLLHEALRLGPKHQLDHVLSCFQWVRHPMYMPAFNTGVIVARKSTYQRFYESYCQAWPIVEQLFSHYAKQQWLLCYLFTSLGLTADILSESFHTHGCFSMVRPNPKRFSVGIDKQLRVNEDVVLLRHNWNV